MERKYKVNDSAAGDASADGAKTKEVALEKLRKMEWKRNTQDPWHLARSHSRGSDVHERKKYNKEEDNYFEGTGVQKTKKLRRPRLAEGSPAVPPGFSVAQASPAPQVNAWTQKKGSALFQREDEIDEDDQVMKLALEASLKSIEEDNKRRLERLKMTNLDLPASSQTMCADKDWEEESRKEDFYGKCSLDGFQEDSAKAELHFVETDVKEEKPTVNQRHRSIPPRTRKISPREKATSPSENHKFDLPESVNKVPSPTVNKNTRSTEGIEASFQKLGNEPDNDDFFEPSRPEAKYSKPVDKVNETTSLSPYVTHSDSAILPKTSVKHANINSDDLAKSFNSTLTFGDTQGLFEKIKEDNELKLTESVQNFKNETPTYLASSNSCSEKTSTNPCEPSETDILLHSFIRHEPPSNINLMVQSNVSDMSAVRQSEPNDLFTLPASPTFSSQNLNSAQCYVPHQMANTEQHPLMNGLVGSALPGGIQISNGRDSSSSVSGSPLQNITPFGSLEEEIPSGVRTGVQVPSHIGNVPYSYPYSMENQESLTRHFQAMQLINQNLSSAMNTEYSSIPTPIRGMMPVNPQVGQPHYRLPTSNMMISPFQGHNISPLLLQHQLQQAHLQQVQTPPGYLSQMLALDTTRLQQSQHSTGIAESDDDATKEQGNSSQSQMQNSNQLLAQNRAQILSQTPQAQILSQAQAQLLSHNKAQLLSQNQPHLLHLQNHPQIMTMQNQPQPVPLVETSTPKQEELLQQHILQGVRAQPGGKTKEELQIEYQNAIQALRRVQEEMQEAQVQPTIPVAQTQPTWGVISPSPAMPLAVNQFFPVGMVPQVHPHLIQLQNTGVSPTIQHTPQNLPGSMNIGPEINLESEINTAQEPTQNSVGRGRGRLH